MNNTIKKLIEKLEKHNKCTIELGGHEIAMITSALKRIEELKDPQKFNEMIDNMCMQIKSTPDLEPEPKPEIEQPLKEIVKKSTWPYKKKE